MQDTKELFEGLKIIEDKYINLMKAEKRRLDKFMRNDKLKTFVPDQQKLIEVSREFYDQYCQLKILLQDAIEERNRHIEDYLKLEGYIRLKTHNEQISQLLIEKHYRDQ